MTESRIALDLPLATFQEAVRALPRQRGEEILVWLDRIWVYVQDQHAPRTPYVEPRDPGEEG